jgi:hypothetical protein
MAERAAAAPETPGVLQVRSDALEAYPRGRSAMLLYAHSGAGCELTLRRCLAAPSEAQAAALARAVRRGGCWIRFGASTSPEADCARLLGQFTERFGAPPVANEPSPPDPDPDETSGS